MDTSIGLDPFPQGEPRLQVFLDSGRASAHPLVIGELACGNLRKRVRISDVLGALPAAKVATDGEVVHLVDANMLHGKGLGWIDAHLLASALLSRIPLRTRDRRLAAMAKTLGVSGK